MITNMSCLDTAKLNDLITVEIDYINSTSTANTFALLFCASTAPHETCNIKQYTSPAFVLQPNETGINYIQFAMPNEPVSYIATLQIWDVAQSKWIDDDSKSCTIDVIKESNVLLYVGAAVAGLVGLYFITKKK